MAINYTPIDIEKLKKEDNKIVSVLLLIVTITLAVLVVLIFFLIKKEMNKNNSNNLLTPSPVVVSPTEMPEETPIATSEPSPTLEPTLFSSPSSQLETPMEEEVLPTTESSNLNEGNE